MASERLNAWQHAQQLAAEEALRELQARAANEIGAVAVKAAQDAKVEHLRTQQQFEQLAASEALR